MEAANPFEISLTNDQSSRHHISVYTLYIAFRMMGRTTKVNVDIVGITNGNKNIIFQKLCEKIVACIQKSVIVT